MVVQKPLHGIKDDPYNACRRWHGAKQGLQTLFDFLAERSPSTRKTFFLNLHRLVA